MGWNEKAEAIRAALLNSFGEQQYSALPARLRTLVSNAINDRAQGVQVKSSLLDYLTAQNAQLGKALKEALA